MSASASSASSATAWPTSMGSSAWQCCALLGMSARARLVKPSMLLGKGASASSASSASRTTAWPMSMSSGAWQSSALLSTASANTSADRHRQRQC